MERLLNTPYNSPYCMVIHHTICRTFTGRLFKKDCIKLLYIIIQILSESTIEISLFIFMVVTVRAIINKLLYILSYLIITCVIDTNPAAENIHY